jgi:pyruvate dehydrogenase E2 component (dihydrolipoamide acetyltransferase)
VQRQAIPEATMTDLLLHAFATAVISLPGVTSGDVGLAVATPDGVMMPVIERADELTVAALVAARQAATLRAREGRLLDVDFVTKPGGSLSNLGTLGVDSFTGIVPLGQLCLLTVGQIKLRPVISADGEFSLRDTLHATLNVDHRVIDGDVAARALNVFGTTFGSEQTWMKGEQL